MAIQLKRSLTSNLNTSYVLAQGQLGIEMPSSINTSDSPFKMKIGDGTSLWSSLPYLVDTSSASSGSLPASVYWLSTKYNRPVLVFEPYKTTGASYDNGECFVIEAGGGIMNWYKAISVTSTESDGTPYVKAGVQLASGSFISLANEQTGDTISLGDSYNKWKAVWSTTGTIQTSDRAAKSNIRYIEEADMALASDESVNPEEIISMSDVFEFINQLHPTTFDYNYVEDTCPNTNRQLGIIADDIKDTKLFDWIGVYDEWDAEPAIVDSNGHELSPAKEAGSSLGLKVLPLAVVALTACKYLLQRVEMLESK